MLPPELLSLVCSYATKPTLKAMRHVCKSHEQAASPYLFDQIFLSNNAADMRIAKLFAIRFKHYIRTLVFSSNYYKDLDEDDFHDEFHYYEGIGEDEDIEAEIAHVEYAYELHLHTRKMQKETFRSGKCPAYLSFVLTNSPNLKKIILTDKLSSRSMPLSSLAEHLP